MKEYIVYKCQECGCEFIILREYVDHNSNYLTCPKHGRHHQIKVIGAFDDLGGGCMRQRKYRRNARGAVEQDG